MLHLQTGGLRTEHYGMKPDTSFEADVLEYCNMKPDTPEKNEMSRIERPTTRRQEHRDTKTETPMERNHNQVSKNRSPVTRIERPEHNNQQFDDDLEEFYRRRPQFRPRKNAKPKVQPKVEERPDSQESTSSLETLASKALKRVADYQEKICKYLTRIHEIIKEPHEVEDIHDLKIRQRRSVEFTNRFVRNHLYQIGRLVSNLLSWFIYFGFLPSLGGDFCEVGLIVEFR